MQVKNFLAYITTFSFLSSFIGYHAIAKNIPNISKDTGTNTLIAQNKKVRTTVASGIGTTLEEASKNAAENALTNIVGSFLDREVILRKRTEIRDGILNKTKVVTTESRDYSQGTIKSFEVIEAFNENNIFRVTASVSVYIDDFRAYIKKLASDSQTMDTGLFAQISTDFENDKNSLKILESIVLPLLSGEVAEITTGNPMRLSEYIKKLQASRNRSNYANQLSRYNQRTTIAVPTTLSINKNFFENMNNKLTNISTKVVEIPSTTFPTYWRCDRSKGECDDLKIGVADIENNYKKIYTIKNLEKIIDETYDNYQTHPLKVRVNSSGTLNYKTINPFYSYIVIELLDVEGRVVARRTLWGGTKLEKNKEIGILCFQENHGQYISNCGGRPVAFYRIGNDGKRVILNQKKFVIILNLNPDKLSTVKKVNVRYQQASGGY